MKKYIFLSLCLLSFFLIPFHSVYAGNMGISHGNLVAQRLGSELIASKDTSVKGVQGSEADLLKDADTYTMQVPSSSSVEKFIKGMGSVIKLVFTVIGSFFKEIASILIKGSSS